jgi:hypothetical protein
MNNFYRLISYLLLAVFSLVNIAGVSAQSVTVLGELQSTGRVFISSSPGKWVPALPNYPLLQGTGVKTEQDGSASVFFKDGSRVDITCDTIVTIAGEVPDYTIHLAEGVIGFNIKPMSSLSVSTASASILVNSKDSIGHNQKSFPALGMISANEKGTEVRSISGRILVASSKAGTRTLTAGESILVGPDDSIYKVSKTQGVGTTEPEAKDSRRCTGALLFLGAAAGEGLIIYGANDILSHKDHHDNPASPSSP